MSLITPNMSLTVWNSLTDKYDHSQLASNFVALDQHDHSPGRGAQINGATGIKDYSIPGSKMSSDFGISLPANSLPGTTIESAASGVGIGTAQIENYSVNYQKIASHPYCELVKTSSTGFVANVYDTTLTNYDSITDNASTTGLSTMGSLTAGTITAPLNGIYMFQGLFEINNTTYPLTGTLPYMAIKNVDLGSYVAISEFPASYYRVISPAPIALTVSGLCKATANQKFSINYRGYAGATMGNATFRMCWISPYDNT